MSTKAKVITSVIVITSAFALGRYTVPTKVITETKIVEVEKKTEDKKQDVEKNTKKRTETTETVKPNGEKTTTTVVTEETNTDKKTDKISTTDKTTDSESKKEVVSGQDKVTISLLGGVQLFNNNGINSLVYGLGISKPVLGPITIGAFGFNDGRVGCSLGLTF